MVCGIDEAGRGSIAGSLFVCGVVCEDSKLASIANLKDSKKLSRKQRDTIYNMALDMGIEHFVLKISPQEIDTNGLSQSLKNALLAIKQNLKASKFIFDGNTNFGVSGIDTLIKGDSLIAQISLASIIAKSLKDKESDELDRIYPQYGFARHKGYGTKGHIEAIKIHSLSPCHRKSFKIASLEQKLF